MRRCVWVIFLKELRENLMDRRSLLTMGLISIAAGPLLLLALSRVMAGFEAQTERRVVLLSGLGSAPHMARYLRSQGYRVEEAPPDFRLKLQTGELADAVVVVPGAFEAALRSPAQQASPPVLALYTDSGNRLAHGAVAGLQRALSAYESHVVAYQLALEGRLLPESDRFQVQVRDLSSEQARAARLLTMLPFFLIMAALYAAWGAAMESIAGERERGVREALLTTPAGVGAIVTGKWLGVWAFSALMTALAIWSFLPTQYLIDSEHLRSIFVLGWRDCLLMTVVTLPASALVAALMMWAAVGAKTLRAAQAQSSLVALVVAVFPTIVTLTPAGAGGAADLLPIAGQADLLNDILRGERFEAAQAGLLSGICLVCTAVLLRWVALRYPKG